MIGLARQEFLRSHARKKKKKRLLEETVGISLSIFKHGQWLTGMATLTLIPSSQHKLQVAASLLLSASSQ